MSIIQFRHPVITIGTLLGLASLFSGCSTLAKQQAAKQYLKAKVLPGVGLGDIHIRQTTLAEVIEKLGRNNKRTVHGGYTYEDCQIIECPIPEPSTSTVELNYKDKGLSFFFERNPGETTPEAELLLDRLQIECVNKRCPFKGKTEQGIRLGDTRAQVKEIYGRPKRAYTTSWLMSYPQGISFLIDHAPNTSGKETDRIEGITIPDRD